MKAVNVLFVTFLNVNILNLLLLSFVPRLTSSCMIYLHLILLFFGLFRNLIHYWILRLLLPLWIYLLGHSTRRRASTLVILVHIEIVYYWAIATTTLLGVYIGVGTALRIWDLIINLLTLLIKYLWWIHLTCLRLLILVDHGWHFCHLCLTKNQTRLIRWFWIYNLVLWAQLCRLKIYIFICLVDYSVTII